MKRLAYLLILIALLSSELFGQGYFHPINLDFEESEAGKLPTGWAIPGYATNLGYYGLATTLQPNGGKFCLELRRDIIDNKEGVYGSAMQTLDAKPYRGKLVKLRAAVRAEISSNRGSAHLWIRERFDDDQTGLFNMMEDRPIVLNTWQFYEVTGRVDENASFINFGLLLMGSGVAWIDDASIEIMEQNTADNLPPSKIDENTISNLEAFAKLFGNIRYFCPSLESQSNDWERFALTGVEVLEKVKTREELKTALKNLFLPLCPDLEISDTSFSRSKKKIVQAPSNSLKNITLAWKHVGPPHVKDNKVFYSSVENIMKSQRDKECSVFQLLDASELQGKSIKFSAWAKPSLIKPSGQAQLWLRIDKEEEKPILTKTMDENPITYDDWREYSISAVVPANAKIIRLGLVLIGEGSVIFDDATLKIVDSDGEKDVMIKNPGFEDSEVGPVARGWSFNPSSQEAGYTAFVTAKFFNKGKKCLLLYSDPTTKIDFPESGDTYTRELIENLYYRMPLTAYVDSLHTLPYPPKNLKSYKCSKPEKFELNGNDRTSRLAATIIFWNMLSQFTLYNDDEYAWQTSLRSTLKRAAEDPDENSFLTSLQTMAANLNDGQSRVWLRDETPRFGFPFLWKWIDNKLVITDVMPDFSDCKPGDIVTEIEGKKAEDYINMKSAKVSSSTKEWKTLRTLAEIRAGNKDTQLKLKIQSGDKVSEISPKRSIYLNELNEKRPPEISTSDSKNFYIDLTRVTDKMFKMLIDTLKNANSIIFDLRGVPLISEHFLGFFTDTLITSVRWQIPVFTKPNQQIVSFKYISGEIKPRKKLKGIKIVFLTDEKTIGYSEGLIATVKAYNLGEVVGTKTAGTCGEVAGIRIPGGYNFSWTIIRAIDSNGNIIFGKGIEPTIPVAPTIKGIIEKRDEIFEKAHELISK